MLRLIIFSVYLCFSITSEAVEKDLEWSNELNDPLKVSEQVYFVDHFYAFDNVLIGYQSAPDMLLLSQSGGAPSLIKTERMITHVPQQKGLKSSDLVIFKSGKLKGTGILLDDFTQEKPLQIKMWLPGLRKIRRFAEPALDDIWGGSHLTYGDLYLRRPRHEHHEWVTLENLPECLEDIEHINVWSHKLLKKDVRRWCDFDSDELIAIKSTPVETSPWYDYRIRLIDRHSYAEYQSEYFKSNQLVKRTQKNWHDTHLTDPRAMIWNFWTVVIFEDGKRIGESLAWIEDHSYAWNQAIKKNLWSERTLRKIRR